MNPRERFFMRRKIVRILRDTNPRLVNRIKASLRKEYGIYHDEHGNPESPFAGHSIFGVIDALLSHESHPFMYSNFSYQFEGYPTYLQKMILDWYIECLDRWDNYDKYYSD